MMCMSGRKTWPVSRETRPRVVSRMARGCSLDFLEHEVLVAGFFGLDGVPGDALDF